MTAEAKQLPESVSELVRVLGEVDALALMQAFPKMLLDIPYHASRSDKFRGILNEQAIIALCETYGGERLYIPDDANILRAYRDQSIINDYGKKSVPELAREHGLSVRWIHKIQEPCREEQHEDQGSLF